MSPQNFGRPRWRSLVALEAGHAMLGVENRSTALALYFALLSTAARTLSLTRVMRMTDDDARDTFKHIRWAATDGEPFCPHCGCLTVYALAGLRLG
jgi:hypothetical protein